MELKFTRFDKLIKIKNQNVGTYLIDFNCIGIRTVSINIFI